MEINLISSLPYSDEIRTMHTKNDNIEIMMRSETKEFIKELFESLSKRYKKNIFLEESMRGSEFAHDSVDALYYNLN